MSTSCRAIVFTAPGKIELQKLTLAPCGEHEIIAQTIYSFVSPGTELRLLSGVKESEGKFPFIPGYSWVGRVTQVGSKVTGWREGDLVTGRNPQPIPSMGALWGGQASHHRCLVAGHDAVLRLPEGANPWDYVTVEVGAIAWRGTSIAMPMAGQTAVVVGQGMVGALAAKWLITHGLRVIVTDLHTSRLERAKRWGAAGAVIGGQPDTEARIQSLIGFGAEIVVEATSSTSAAAFAAKFLRKNINDITRTGYPLPSTQSLTAFPRLVLLATYTQTAPFLPSGVIPGEGVLVLQPMDRTVDDRWAVIEAIRKGQLTTADIVDQPTPVEDAPAAYARLRDQPQVTSAVCFAW